jgi:hypothetical protein
MRALCAPYPPVLHHASHTFLDGIVPLGVHTGLVFGEVLLLQAIRMAHGAHHVWIVVPALVREDRGEVGHLQRGDQHFALPDAHAVDGAEGPTLLAILPIVIGYIGDVATLGRRQVDREPLTQDRR